MDKAFFETSETKNDSGMPGLTDTEMAKSAEKFSKFMEWVNNNRNKKENTNV